MNKEQLAGTLDIIKGRAKRRMGRVAYSNRLRVEGLRDEMVGRAKQGYGLAKEHVTRRHLGTVAAAAAGFAAVVLGRRLVARRRAN